MKNQKERRKENVRKLLLRVELWFAPSLIIVPVLISVLFLWDWYVRGFSQGISAYDGEFIIGVVILLGNILFDVPFLKNLISLNKTAKGSK